MNPDEESHVNRFVTVSHILHFLLGAALTALFWYQQIEIAHLRMDVLELQAQVSR